MIRHLREQALPDDGHGFYASLSFSPEPEFWSRVAGAWLGNDANR
jgi:hypothetical protein